MVGRHGERPRTQGPGTASRPCEVVIAHLAFAGVVITGHPAGPVTARSLVDITGTCMPPHLARSWIPLRDAQGKTGRNAEVAA